MSKFLEQAARLKAVLEDIKSDGHHLADPRSGEWLSNIELVQGDPDTIPLIIDGRVQ